jgi:response regulator of citrate/malate metabolism
MLANSVEMKALSRGASSVLQKPFSNERFHAALKRFYIHDEKIKNVSKVQLG